MGRYYNGDIEGKFWFAVQSSDDASFFGVEPYEEPQEIDEETGELEEACYCTYDFNREEHLKIVIDKVKICEKTLGDKLEHLNNYFNVDMTSYNNEGLLDHFHELGFSKISLADIQKYLEWFARLGLGLQIQQCLIENEFCVFEAEY
jgi:hypothetical protein